MTEYLQNELMSLSINPNRQNEFSQADAASKNRDEYNFTAISYNTWCEQNIIMQKFCYHSCINEMKIEGIQDKVFAEIACGTCPIGKALAINGAKKVYGIDISE